MAKRGRPAKKKLDVTNVITKDESTLSQLALNQVDHANKFARIDMAINSIVKSIDDFVNTANKINSDLAKRIQAIESRCCDMEKKLTLPELEESEEEEKKDSEC